MFNERISTYVIAALSFFLSGMEYAIIIPTLNSYLLSMDSQSYFIGLALSAMGVAGLLASPVFGRITDITKKTKLAVIIGNIFEIGGNIMYFWAPNPYWIVGSRVIVGIGSSSITSVLSMLNRSSTKSEMTSMISRIFAGRQVGLVIGPACNLFLQEFDFYIASVHINKYTAPGFFMAVLWCAHTVLVVIFYYDLEYLRQDETETVTHPNKSIQEDNSEVLQENVVMPVPFLKQIKKDLLSEEVIVFLAMAFIVMFVQLAIEAIITPVSRLLLDWGSIQNSIYYAASGALYVICLLLIPRINKKVPDRMLLLFGIVVLTLDNLMFLVFIIFAVKEPTGTPWVFALFNLYGAVLAFGVAFGWVALISLFSKFTSEANQGFNQSMRLLFMRFGQIMGPLWGSYMLDNLTLMAAVNFGLLALLSIMFFATFDRIRMREQQYFSVVEEKVDENSPLVT